KGKVPIVADFMASRWAYEAMAVHQFKNNDFQKSYYELNKGEAQADFKAAYVEKELRKKRQYILENYQSESDSIKGIVAKDLAILKKELMADPFKEGIEDIDFDRLTPGTYSPEIDNALNAYLNAYKKHYQKLYNENVKTKDKKIFFFENNGDYNLNEYKDAYFNQSLADLVTNVNEKDRIIEYQGELIQQFNSVYNEPDDPSNPLDYRAHFFAPVKHFIGSYFDTYFFNLLVIWLMTILLYAALYFELLRKGLSALSKIKFGRK
ncbi:MAG: ABC transporter, partial [Bacteroidota bacterium]